MSLHEIKYCPRCAASFECKAGNIANCQCAQVELSNATRAYLAENNSDCLCKKCLEEINEQLSAKK